MAQGVPPDETVIFAKAREYTAGYIRGLPDFVCTAVTRRMNDDPGSRDQEIWNRFRLSDVLVGQLSYRYGKESYVAKTSAGSSRSSGMGLTTAGEFGSISDALFLPDTKAAIDWSHWETFGGRRAAVFRYSVAKVRSRFKVVVDGSLFDWFRFLRRGHPDEEALPPGMHGLTSVQVAYHGVLFVEPDSGAILRVTRQALGLRSDFPVARMDTVVDYRPAEIGGRYYTLPAASVTLSQTYRWVTTNQQVPRHLLNEVRFSDYHKFEAESVLIPGYVVP